MSNKKISIIGAGAVGASVAQVLAIKDVADIYIFDIVDGLAAGKALDIQEGAPHWGFDYKLRGFCTADEKEYENLKGSDVIVVTAGLARKPGMSRDDLLLKNIGIMKDVGEKIKKYSPESIIVAVTNPADIMAYALQKASGIEPSRILGLGGSLDSARFRTFLAEALDVSVEDVNAFVIGGHGDDMVPFIRYSSVSGIPIEHLLPKEKIDEIIKRTRFGGGEILNLYKTGTAFYAPSISIAVMVESIIKNKKRVIPCAAYLTGNHAKHYGIENMFIGVPIKIGASGVEEIYDLQFNEEDKAAWEKSVESVKKNSKLADDYFSGKIKS
ncbi:malate dehydrogenase [Acidiplasma sp.]|uniref:malate dehydrogenase n=1 Tax=Acidiplasma sp. TaxID=1872114 RepID=UPI002582DEDA|nr:malate dehydrogenase [Acidiplasma sp.]